MIDEKDDRFSVSLLTAVIGLVLTCVVGVPSLIWWRMKDVNFASWVFLVFTCLFSLEVSACTAWLRERREKSGKIGLVVSGTVMIVALVVVGSTGVSVRGAVFPILIVAGMAAVAGVVAVSRKNWRSRAVMLLVGLWLVPTALLTIGGILAQPDYITTVKSLAAGFALLFGPWATLVAKLCLWPNAGEFFNLPGAVALTAVLVSTVTAALRIEKRPIAAPCLLLCVPLIFSWTIIGAVQLVNCAL